MPLQPGHRLGIVSLYQYQQLLKLQNRGKAVNSVDLVRCNNFHNISLEATPSCILRRTTTLQQHLEVLSIFCLDEHDKRLLWNRY